MTRVYRGVLLGALFLVGCAAPKKEPPKRDADPAIATIQDQITKDSTNWQLYKNLATELRRKSRYAEAESVAGKAFLLEPSPGNSSKLEIAMIHAANNQMASAANLLTEILKKKSGGEAADEVDIATVFVMLDDTTKAFEWLNRAVSAKSPNLATLADNPDLMALHKDPRWAQVTSSKM